jgi:hypothetical protein
MKSLSLSLLIILLFSQSSMLSAQAGTLSFGTPDRIYTKGTTFTGKLMKI